MPYFCSLVLSLISSNSQNLTVLSALPVTIPLCSGGTQNRIEQPLLSLNRAQPDWHRTLSGREARLHLIRGEAQRPQGAVVGVHRLQQGSRRQLEDLQLSALTRNKKAQCVWNGMHPYVNKRGIKKWPRSSALALERLYCLILCIALLSFFHHVVFLL